MLESAILSDITNTHSSTAEYFENPIQVASCTVENLFDSSHTFISGTNIKGDLTIPEYQRPYLWGTSEVCKLISDLEEHFASEDLGKPLYYMGSIILHQEKGRLNVIDGQQRITTLALLQAVLGNEAPSIRYDSPISIFNIQENYKVITSANNIHQLRKIDFSQLNVTLIMTYNEDDAYTFFETQNTGGVRLSGVDIIKAHHLREVTSKGGQQDHYAQRWESLHAIDTVIESLIKARRWGVLNWREVPSDRDVKGTKNSIIEDFSIKTLKAKHKAGYQHVLLSDNYSKLVLQSAPLAVRQPLSNGENFIDYLSVFSELYQRLFKQRDDIEIPDEFYRFDEAIIKKIDGTAFLKEFYEIAILCYASRFGFSHILEAGYWIFRYSYSMRVSHEKAVREDSIPSFINKKGNYLFDHILHSFNHTELMEKLRSFRFELNTENMEGNTVKSRFVNRVAGYFGFTPGWNWRTDFDMQLITNIKKKTDAVHL
jgi:hypothetical protein